MAQAATTVQPSSPSGQGAPPPAAQVESPKCPVCGGPMRSNAAKIAEGKKMPLWTCQGSNYDLLSKTELGCKGVIWPPKEAGSAALTVHKPGAVAMTDANAPQLDFKAIPIQIMARAAAIAAEAQANNSPINAAQALAAAFHFANTGEVMGRHSYVGTTGNVTGKVLEGYRAVARPLDMSQYQFRYRPLTDAERQMHGVTAKQDALACELDVLKARARCIRMSIPYDPIVGVGIVDHWEKEKKEAPKTKTWYWVLQKRARVDALRQVGEKVSADDEIEEAEAQGLDMSAAREMQEAGAHLDQEQAEILVDAAVRDTAQALLPPEQKEAEAKAAADARALDQLRAEVGMWLYEQAFEANPANCPRCNAPFVSRAHTTDCLFRLAFPLAPLWPPEAEPEPEPAQPAVLAAIEPYRTRLRANIYHVTPATARQKNWMVSALTLLDPDENGQNDLLEWAFGIPSIDILTAGMGEGLVEWLAPTKSANGDMQIDPTAVAQYAEIKAALADWKADEQPTLLAE